MITANEPGSVIEMKTAGNGSAGFGCPLQLIETMISFSFIRAAIQASLFLKPRLLIACGDLVHSGGSPRGKRS